MRDTNYTEQGVPVMVDGTVKCYTELVVTNAANVNVTILTGCGDWSKDLWLHTKKGPSRSLFYVQV